MAGWFDDAINAVGSLFGGGDSPVATTGASSGPSIWSAILPAAIQGASQYIQGQGAGDLKKQELAQTLDEAQKNRDFQKELLMLKASLGGGGGGGGGASGPDPRVLRQNAINTGVSAALQGGQLTQSSLANLVANVQRGLAQVQSSRV